MRATLDRKKQAVALASLFDVRIRNSSKRKSASKRGTEGDGAIVNYLPIYIYTHTGVFHTCLHATVKCNECCDIAITNHQK